MTCWCKSYQPGEVLRGSDHALPNHDLIALFGDCWVINTNNCNMQNKISSNTYLKYPKITNYLICLIQLDNSKHNTMNKFTTPIE